MSDVLRDVRDLMEQHARVRVYDGQRRSVRAEGVVIGYCPVPMLIIRRDDGTLVHESSELPREVVPTGMAWCVTCACDHIRTIPTDTWRCADCGWAQWDNESALHHAHAYRGHGVFVVHHQLAASSA